MIHMGLSDCTTPGSQMDNNSEKKKKSWNLNLLETGKAVCHAGLVMVSASQKVLISVQPLDLRKEIQSQLWLLFRETSYVLVAVIYSVDALSDFKVRTVF